MDQGHVFLGQGGGSAVYDRQVGTYQDAGASYEIRAKTVRFLGAGINGDALYRSYVLSIRYTMAVTLRITPYLDGEALDAQTITLSAQSELKTDHFEFGLSKSYKDSFGTQLIRNGARGTALEILLESVGGVGAGELICEVSKLEYRVLRTSTKPQVLT